MKELINKWILFCSILHRKVNIFLSKRILTLFEIEGKIGIDANLLYQSQI